MDNIDMSKKDFVYFPGCREIEDKTAKRKCFDEKMYEYLQQQANNKVLKFALQNPKFQQERPTNFTKDSVFTSFIVEKDGSVSNPCIIRSTDTIYHQMAIEIIEEMPNWRKYSSRHLALRKKLTVPIVFDFQEIPPPPPLPKEVHPCDTLFKSFIIMPQFPACQEFIGNNAQMKKCSDTKMLDFIDEYLIYPEAARKDSIEGMVVVRFIVHENGELANIEVVRNKLGDNFGEAALEVVKKMPDWIPGRQCQGPVKVQYNLPIKFKL